MSLGRFEHYWNTLRASYWFIPSLMVTSALALALGTEQLDARLGTSWARGIEFLVASRPEGARAVLSAIAGSMITVAGVTFSMTLVSVSYAASQFGPRLVGNFMRDTGNQVTLGVFIATFVYCLSILRTVRSADPNTVSDPLDAFVPHISILVAMLMALACVGVLIYFIHHVPETINAGNITASVGRALKREIQTLFPDSIGEDVVGADEVENHPPEVDLTSAAVVRSSQDAFVVAIDSDRLAEIARVSDLVVRLQYRPGDFAITGDILLHAWPASRCGADVVKALDSVFAWAVERTPEQNILFLVDELVEIVARALSPGVNDPFTAISALHWLHSGLREVVAREAPSPYRFDEEGVLRVIAHPVGFGRFLNAVTDQSLQYVSADRNASLESLRLLAEVALSTPKPAYREALLDKADRLVRAAEKRLPIVSDRELMRERYEELQSALADESAELRLRDDQGWLGGRA